MNSQEIEIATIKSGDNLILGEKYFINIDENNDDISGIYQFIYKKDININTICKMYIFIDQENTELQIINVNNTYKTIIKIHMYSYVVNCFIYERVIKTNEYILK